MSDNIERIQEYRELAAKLDPTADEALSLIKSGKHKEGYDKIIEIMNSCDYSHPKGWADMAVLTIRQAAADTDVVSLQPAEKGFKKAVDFYAHILGGDNGLFELGKIIFDNINTYSNIYKLKVKADSSASVMTLLDDATGIPDNGYNSTRQKEQLNSLQNKIDKVKEQGKLDISTAALSELAVYEHFLGKVKELDAYGENSIETAESLKEKIDSIENFDKEYLIDVVQTACNNIRNLIDENISLSKKAIERRIEKEKEDAINRYWEEHSEEKAELDRRLDAAKQGMKELDEQFGECEKQYAEINKKRDKFVSSFADEKKGLELDRDELNEKMNNLGRFKTKEKKTLTTQLDELNAKIDEVNKKIADEKKDYNESIDRELIPIAEKKKDLAARDNELSSEIKIIKEELTKDRI
ncbi:MAG: hypothetical protein II931_00395 [Clostridia bacterium]|nr:hypothetical protein [Clostridia bacterium]